MPADWQIHLATGAALLTVTCISIDDLEIEVGRDDSHVGSGGAPLAGGTEAGAGATAGSASPVAGGGDGSDAATPGYSGEGTGGRGEKPQCGGGDLPLRTVFTEHFESHATGSLYAQDGAAWVQANVGRDAQVIESSWAHSGEKSLVLYSYTTRSEIAYVPLELNGPPRRVVIEHWYTPSGSLVYLDFAEFGLGTVHSRFDLEPAVAFEVNDHVLELRADPEKPVASTNGANETEAATKPPAQELFDEVLYAVCAPSLEPPTCPAIHNYIRIELDFCADIVRAFVGPDVDAPLVGSGNFDGTKAVNAYYLAGGLNSTYVDGITIHADDG